MLQAHGFRKDELFKRLHLVRAERNETKIFTDSGLMFRDSGLPRCVDLSERCVELQLQGNKVQKFLTNLERLLGWKAMEQADERERPASMRSSP